MAKPETELGREEKLGTSPAILEKSFATSTSKKSRPLAGLERADVRRALQKISFEKLAGQRDPAGEQASGNNRSGNFWDRWSRAVGRHCNEAGKRTKGWLTPGTGITAPLFQ
jgi:hypothetical protein